MNYFILTFFNRWISDYLIDLILFLIVLSIYQALSSYDNSILIHYKLFSLIESSIAIFPDQNLHRYWFIFDPNFGT